MYFALSRIPALGNRLRVVILITIFTLLVVVLSAAPPENLFVSFKTPENAFRYAYNGSIEGVLSGRDSSMVIFETNQGVSSCVFPRTRNGYKLSSIFSVNKRTQRNLNGAPQLLQVHHVRKTNDYYIVVAFYLARTEVEVFDESDNRLDFDIIRSTSSGQIIYIYVEGLTDGAYMLVEDKRIPLFW
ncbi:MAG: hypothetical protein FWG78_01305 [Coriobacteriia bacterium]|nr:hypothetical protein [Coriobacteriia bacterium]